MYSGHSGKTVLSYINVYFYFINEGVSRLITKKNAIFTSYNTASIASDLANKSPNRPINIFYQLPFT